MSYYGYVEREASSYINWAEAAKGMTDVITTQNKIREEKKKEIDDNSRELSKFLMNNPLGASKSASDYSMQLAGTAQDYLLSLNKMLKSGGLNLNDYLTRVQNFRDDIESGYSMLTEYQERAKQVAERSAKGENQSLEELVFEELEGYANFNNTYAYVNPETGNLWNAKMEEVVGPDGKKTYQIPKTPSGKLQPVSLLRKRMNTNYDKFKMAEEAKAMSANFGDQIRVIESVKNTTNATGLMKEILDPTNRKALETLPPALQKTIRSFTDAETALIESKFVNPFNVTSVLLDQMLTPDGKPYGYTYDEAVAANDPTKILLTVVDGKLTPVFDTPNGKKQKEAAMERFRLELRMTYKYDEKAQVTPQLADRSQRSYGGGGGGGSRSSSNQSSSTEQAPAGGGGYQPQSNQPKATTYDATEASRNMGTIINTKTISKGNPVTTANNLAKELAPFGFSSENFVTKKKTWLSGDKNTVEIISPIDKNNKITINLDAKFKEEDLDKISNWIISNTDESKLMGLYPYKLNK